MTHEGLAIGHSMAELAAANAGEAWTKEALDAFQDFAKIKEVFTTEQVREAYPDLPAPHELRAWGHVARLAKQRGFVTSVGWVRAQSRSVHGMVVTQWQSKIYKGASE